jgi:adenylate cyclase
MSIGFAYVEMGRYADAVPILEHDLTVFPNIMPTHLNLIEAYVELGREDDARAAAAEIMRMSPRFTLALLPRSRDAGLDKRLQDDLRKAGLK